MDVTESERGTRYVGTLFWPVTAALSLFGTTSILMSAATIALGMTNFGRYEEWLALAFFLSFILSVLGSTIGGAGLLFTWRSGLRTLTIRGKRIADERLRWWLLLCYAAPWIMMAVGYVWIVVGSILASRGWR